MKTMRLNKINGINSIEFDVLTNGYVTSTITMDIHQLYKHLTDGRTCSIDEVSLNKDASDDYMSQIYFPLIESTGRDLYDVWLNATLNNEDADAAVRLYIENKRIEIVAKTEMILADDDYDYDFDITRADYEDAEEMRLVDEYNKRQMNNFKDDINKLSEAANELRDGVFDYIPQALDNLINTVSKLSDPYLNMMYADEDFERAFYYDPSDDYYVDDFAECYAA